MESFVGRDVGKYHIIEQLGTGGMAVVYKTFDTSLERYLAIKFIRKETIGEQYYPQLLTRFEREAKVLASLNHPYIVTIIDYGQYQGSPYLVMPFISGGSLHPDGRPMPYPQAARLLAPVARALEYAHRRGVIHRDIKPDNILITENGDPTLSDFGIAKILDTGGSAEQGTLTSTGMAIGTPEYMAPEQWQGKPVAQSDIYGLGVVLFELVTGKLPYTANTPAAVMIKQATEPLPRPRQFAPGLPDALERVIFKALALKPENRYANMGDFATALEGLAQGAAPRPLFPGLPARPGSERARQEAEARTQRLAEDKSRSEAADRMAQEKKRRDENEEKVRRLAAKLASEEKEQAEAAELARRKAENERAKAAELARRQVKQAPSQPVRSTPQDPVPARATEIGWDQEEVAPAQPVEPNPLQQGPALAAGLALGQEEKEPAQPVEITAQAEEPALTAEPTAAEEQESAHAAGLSGDLVEKAPPRRTRARLAWPIRLAIGGAGVIGLVLLGVWLASVASGPARLGQASTASPQASPQPSAQPTDTVEAATPTPEAVAVVESTATPLPEPTIAKPVKPSFILQFTSSSDWAAVIFKSGAILSNDTRRVAVRGDPLVAARDGQRINLNQEINRAFAGHEMASTYEVFLSDIESGPSMDIALEAGCLGQTEVEFMTTVVDPPIVVYRYLTSTCDPQTFTVPTELLKTNTPNAVARIGPPPPVFPLSADNDESKVVIPCPGMQPPNQQLCIIRYRSGTMQELPVGAYLYISSPGWSGDGQKIYFNGSNVTNAPWEAYVINADGTGKSRLLNQTSSVSWSPNNQAIAYAVDCRVLRIMRPDGTGRRVLNTPGARCVEGERWSPDSSQIAFLDLFNMDKVPPSVWVINQDGTGLRRIYQFDAPVWVIRLAWNPDGNTVGVWFQFEQNSPQQGFLLNARAATDPMPIDWTIPLWWTEAFWPQWGR